MLDVNFLRAEIHHADADADADEHQYALALIGRLDNDKFKVVLSLSRPLTALGERTEFFAYYSYVNDDFAPRAELTEDFLDTGHALSFELQGRLPEHNPLTWLLNRNTTSAATPAEVS
ncbi:hypothetical protein AT746_03520 [Lacimicrobium alkaliphilum]|uniref:Uncharacterized protein n=2 Tax=Lacimicrobium alkaliphilum TaxID=1526571 RepID=A0A0U3B1M7_9ALTE|nr:hypothetical protein AT746_03520 [Lacimicrobium alkaliphilum]